MKKIEIFMIGKRGNYNARAIYDNGKITVLKGSRIKEKSNSDYKRNKQALSYREDKTIVSKDLVLLKDVVFDSPSTASQFIVDSSRNGWKDWKNKDKQNLKEILKGE